MSWKHSLTRHGLNSLGVGEILERFTVTMCPTLTTVNDNLGNMSLNN